LYNSSITSIKICLLSPNCRRWVKLGYDAGTPAGVNTAYGTRTCVRRTLRRYGGAGYGSAPRCPAKDRVGLTMGICTSLTCASPPPLPRSPCFGCARRWCLALLPCEQAFDGSGESSAGVVQANSSRHPPCKQMLLQRWWWHWSPSLPSSSSAVGVPPAIHPTGSCSRGWVRVACYP
jgi:hypothetical protein